jgi:predicted membrane protein
MFLLDNFYIFDIGDFIGTFWPLILVIIGVKIIIDRREAKDKSGQERIVGENQADSNAAENINSLSESNVFGDIEVKVKSSDFTGGTVNNIFGDINLDISSVELNKGITNLYVSGVFGDVTIRLPMNIAHKVKTSCVAGDLKIFENRRDGIMPSLIHEDPTYQNASKKIFIQASVIFGSVSIITQ